MPSPHRYGPHRPEDAPNAVTILSGGTTSRTPVRREVVPMPPALVRQRAQVNARAQLAALQRWGWHCSCGLWHEHGELCPDGGWIV